MNYLGKRKRDEVVADTIDANLVDTKKLCITDEYCFPEQKGNDGDVLVQDPGGDLVFEAPATFPTEYPTLTVDQMVVGEDPQRYILPLQRGSVGEVLRSDGGTATSWQSIQPSESKGDLLFFQTAERAFSFSDGTTLRNLSNTSGNLGSLTIPALSMTVGDVYTLRVTGQWKASTTTGPIFFRVQVRSDATVLADTNNGVVSVDQYIGGQSNPTVPFTLLVSFAVRSDPLTPTADNIYTSAQLHYADSVDNLNGQFLDVYAGAPLSWDNTSDITVGAYGLIALQVMPSSAYNRTH